MGAAFITPRKVHLTVGKRKERVVLTATNKPARLERRATLTHDDRTDLCSLATIELHATILRVTVATVPR